MGEIFDYKETPKIINEYKKRENKIEVFSVIIFAIAGIFAIYGFYDLSETLIKGEIVYYNIYLVTALLLFSISWLLEDYLCRYQKRVIFKIKHGFHIISPKKTKKGDK